MENRPNAPRMERVGWKYSLEAELNQLKARIDAHTRTLRNRGAAEHRLAILLQKLDLPLLNKPKAI